MVRPLALETHRVRVSRLGSTVLWLLLVLLPVSAAPVPENSSGAAIQPATAKPRFVLFKNLRWYPMRPPSDPAIDNLTLGAFIALPCLAGFALRFFFKKTKSSAGPVSLIRLAMGNLLVLFFLLSTMLLAGEIRYRFFYDTTDSLAFTKISDRWVTRHWQVNGAGCRDNIEYSAAIPIGKRRISFVGDSFTAGHGVKNVEDRFTNRLRALHPDWEVHSLANIGLDTGAEIALLKKALSRGYQFDEVVLVYCLNDVCDLLIAPGKPFERSLPPLDQHGPWFIRGSYSLDLFYFRWKASQNPYVKDYFSFVKEGYRGEYWNEQQKRLKELRDLVEVHDGRLSVVTFPFLNDLGPKYGYGFVHDQLNSLWKSLNVPHLDLLSVYAGHRSTELTVNPHDAHPNEFANKLAADAINSILWPTLTNRHQALISDK